MRPTLRLLSDDLIQRILDEARMVLKEVGVEIQSREVLDLLVSHGARADAASRVFIPEKLVEWALKSSPSSFHLYDLTGRATHFFFQALIFDNENSHIRIGFEH